MVKLRLERTSKIFEFWFEQEACASLHQTIMNNAKNLDKGAIMTDWNFKPFIPVAQSIVDKIKQQDNLSQRLLITEVFGQYYDIGHYQEEHAHKPAHFSFVLFTNAPEGSSDLCFKDICIKAETGKAIVFPGDLHHHVPINKGKNRSVVVGNLQYEISSYNS